MKKSSVLLSGLVIAGLSPVAQSIDFNDKIYGKMNVVGMYNFNKFVDSDVEEVNFDKHSIALGLGFDVYYKLMDEIHPFAGLQVKSSLPVSNLLGLNTREAGDVSTSTYQITNIFSLEGRFGAKFNINKNISIAPYYLLGYNMSFQQNTITNDTDDSSETTKSYHHALSTGVGVDAIFLDKWIVGFEYKWTGVGKLKSDNGGEGQKNDFHQIGIRLGSFIF